MDREYDVVGGYIPSFVQHLKDTGARLGSQIGSQVNEDRINAEGAVEDVAEAHALSSWTPAEHDIFFRALSVHSRWRPDLIATCIPTRTEWEVWMYLEALEEGAGTLAMQEGGEDVDMECGSGDVSMQVDRFSSDPCSYSGSDTDEDEDMCEPALEVSQAWIDVEEHMASWIVHEEYLASVEDDAAADAEDVDGEPPKRKRGRPRGAGKGRAQSRVRGQTISSEGRHSPPPVRHSPSLEPTSTSARNPSRDPSALLARKREALMGRLEVPHLLVLDGILREGGEAMQEKSKSREGSVTAAALAEHGTEEVPRARDVEVSSLTDRTTALQGTSNVSGSPSNVVIDPVLLALSGDAGPAGPQLSQVPSESPSTGCAPAHVPTQGPSSSLNASSQPGTSNTFMSPLSNVILTNPDQTTNNESDLSLFSPRSRRRLQKRLYMRRKRAQLRENGAAPEGAVDAGIERRKPGKKAKSERSEALAVPTSAPRSEAPSDAEMESSENVCKKIKGGLTLPYKLKARFAQLDIDAAYLRGQGMDLFNLSALGKLMGLYSSLEHGEEEADESAITQSIDAQLIRHLQAATVSFVTDIMHRVIVWREREIRLKQRSLAWRHGDQITISAVEHAVEAIGARYLSHKEYFKSLEVLHGEPSSAPANASEPNPTSASIDPDVEAADQYTEPPGVSLHRDVYTPLIHPPSAWKIAPLTCLTRTYEREATRTRRGASADIEEDELMSDQTDEEALEAELEEEDEADEWDMQLAETYEDDLWDAVRRKQ